MTYLELYNIRIDEMSKFTYNPKKWVGLTKSNEKWSFDINDSGVVCKFHPHEKLNITSRLFRFSETKPLKQFKDKCNTNWNKIKNGIYHKWYFDFENVKVTNITIQAIKVMDKTICKHGNFLANLRTVLNIHKTDVQYTEKYILDNLNQFFTAENGHVVEDKLGVGLLYTNTNNLIENIENVFKNGIGNGKVYSSINEYKIYEYVNNIQNSNRGLIKKSYVYYLLKNKVSRGFASWLSKQGNKLVTQGLTNNWYNDTFLINNGLDGVKTDVGKILNITFKY